MEPSDRKAAISRLKAEGSYSAYTALSNLNRKTGSEDRAALRLAVLRNVTIEPLLPVIEGETALLGLHPEVYVGDFDAIASDVLDSESSLYRHNPDVIILFQWLEVLSPALSDEFTSLSAADVEANIEHVLNVINMQVTAIRKHSNAPILINNFPTLYRATLGILEAQGGEHETRSLQRLNEGLVRLAQESANVFCIDLAAIFGRVGLATAFDDRYWTMARAPIGKGALVPVGKEFGRFLRALTGNARKCLVLDCDGTLWGGIVGEEGVDGIRLGHDYPGNSYVAFQKEVLNLYRRGVILAICSKNNEEDVLEVLRNHPNMLLREEHFAAMRVNWTDKAENILSIAEELNIGVDSLVFADDTDFECDRVRSALPEVDVLQLKGEPSSFKRQLSEAGLFDSLTFSAEDHKRTASYRAERQRKAIQETAASLEDYLLSLEIRAKIAPAESSQIPRVAQLTQKTNQFNLTTRRYTETDIQAFCREPNKVVLFLWLADKMAEFGIVGVAITTIEEKVAHIDSFLLSCRALGREAEKALLACVVGHVRAHGCETLLAYYRRTKKNVQVSDFYRKFGFQLVREGDDGTDWTYSLTDAGAPEVSVPAWIKLVTPE